MMCVLTFASAYIITTALWRVSLNLILMDPILCMKPTEVFVKCFKKDKIVVQDIDVWRHHFLLPFGIWAVQLRFIRATNVQG
jgi:hypothetical protein